MGGVVICYDGDKNKKIPRVNFPLLKFSLLRCFSFTTRHLFHIIFQESSLTYFVIDESCTKCIDFICS